MISNLIICFQGADGSGKSTLAKALAEDLQSKEIRTSYLWWLDGENTSLRRFLRSLSSKPVSGKTNDSQAIMRSPFHLYPALVFFDYLAFGMRLRIRFSRLWGRRVVIFDRFMFDVIRSLRDEFGLSDEISKIMLKVSNLVLPRPELIILVDVSPSTAYSRKSDEISSVDEARRAINQIEAFVGLLDGRTRSRITRVANDGPLEPIRAKTLEKALYLWRGHA